MRVPRDHHSRLYFRLRNYGHIIFRVTPEVAAGGAPCADASVAMNPVSPQIAQDAKPAKPRRVSMTTSLPGPDRQRPDFRDEIISRWRLAGNVKP
jgi:hypothetical protein